MKLSWLVSLLCLCVCVSGACLDNGGVSTFSDGLTSAGATFCVLSDGLVYCWGFDDNHQTGIYDILDNSFGPFVVSAPGRAREIEGAVKVVVGQYHTCALVNDGSVWCWGLDKGNGEVGQTLSSPGSQQFFNTPAPITVLGGGPFMDVSAGEQFTCVQLKADSSITCFGSGNGVKNLDGETDGPSGDSSTGLKFTHISDAIGLASGYHDTCAWKADGTAVCWGDNQRLALAIDSSVTSGWHAIPLTDIMGMDLGFYHCCAWLTNGDAYCWGGNLEGAVGDNNAGTDVSVPYKLPPIIGSVVKMALGLGHTCALNDNGEVWCWGSNGAGQLGLGFLGVPVQEPVSKVLTTKKVVDLMASGDNTCILTEFAEIQCFGDNSYGSLGQANYFLTADSFAAAPVTIGMDGICGSTWGVGAAAAGGAPHPLLSIVSGGGLNGPQGSNSKSKSHSKAHSKMGSAGAMTGSKKKKIAIFSTLGGLLGAGLVGFAVVRHRRRAKNNAMSQAETTPIV
jgi:alpha-tubulin suppressor-like RCC1 family protein